MKSIIFLFVLLVSICAPVHAETQRIAMLISSHGSEASPQLSYDLEELAQAYLVLHDNDLQIDIISPKGGPVLVKNHKDDLAYIQRFKALALEQLNNTLAVSAVKRQDYAGIFIIGGGGAMIDLPKHAPTQALLTEFVQRDALITAVCHGPAAIADIKLADGSYFVAGKRVNSFTNLEEHAFSAENLADFPFLIEDRLRENGALFVSNAPMLPYVSVDDNLITAQNPSAVATAAEAMVVKLGLPLQPRKPFLDEATMALIAKARANGPFVITTALATEPENYDLNYLALYGFYAYKLASDEEKPTELRLMQTIANHFEHPMYTSNLIKALKEQGKNNQAESVFAQFKQQYPEHQEIGVLTNLLFD